MPEPDFEQMASELATHFLATEGLDDGWFERNELRIAAALRQVWNARGAAAGSVCSMVPVRIGLVCRYCSTPLMADGDGGWTCPQRERHAKSVTAEAVIAELQSDIRAWKQEYEPSNDPDRPAFFSNIRHAFTVLFHHGR